MNEEDARAEMERAYVAHVPHFKRNRGKGDTLVRSNEWVDLSPQAVKDLLEEVARMRSKNKKEAIREQQRNGKEYKGRE